MARLKKSLALLLAFVMMFSSMSVAASAWTVEEEDKGVSFEVKFFRYGKVKAKDAETGEYLKDEKGNFIYEYEKDEYGEAVKDENGKVKYIYDWIETTNAAPGEAVKARVYVSTEFASYAGELALLFDSDYFIPGSAYSEGASVVLTTNNNYTGTDPKTNVSGKYALSSTGSWRHNESKWSRFSMDFIKENMLTDNNGNKVTNAAEQAVYFDNRDLIATTFGFDSGINNFYFDGEQWLMEYDLVVSAYSDENAADSADRTETVDEYGYAKVPEFYDCVDWREETTFVNIYMGEPGVYRTYSYVPMYDFVPEVSTKPAKLTTTSDMVFDANGGLFSEDEADTQRTAKGIIGKAPQGVPTPTRSGYAFKGWSYEAMEPAEGAAGENVVYDYDTITVYAVWAPAKTYYTYERYEMLPDGTYSDEPSYEEEIPADANASITLPQYPIAGFTLDSAKSTPSIVVNADNSSKLKAYYARNKYDVTYHFEDAMGEQTDTLSAYYEAKVPAFAAGGNAGAPVKEGYDFVGWSTDPQKMVTAPEKMPANNIDLYPIYEIKEYTYYFDATEGGVFPTSGNRTYSKIYEYGETPEKPEDPEKEGFVFAGWDFEIPETVTSDMSFEAMFNEAEYTVTFMDGNNVVDSFPLYHGDEITAADVPEGYKAVNSWTLSDNTVVTFPYAVTEDVTFYATDSANVYDANFYTYEDEFEKTGKVLYETIPTVFGEEIAAPATPPEKDGFTFIAWNPDPEDSVMEEDGFEAIAIFEPNTIEITFNANEGTAVESIKKTYGESIEKLPVTGRTGYTFDGWYTDLNGGTKVPEPYAVPTENTTLYAHWIPESHTVTYVTLNDDGTESVHTSITKGTGAAIEAPKAPSKPGHTFAGWLNAETKEIEEAPTTMPVKDTKYIAQWEIKNFRYTVDANGGKFADDSTTKSGTADYGTIINLETPENIGSKFLGWSTDSDDKTVEIPATSTTATITDNMTIKAVWQQELYKITFDAAGGTFDDGTSSYSEDLAYGAAVSEPEVNAPAGFEFDGWIERDEKIGVPQSMPNRNLYFVAQWKEVEIGAQDYTIYAVIVNPATGEELPPMIVKQGSLDVGKTVEVVMDAADSTADVPVTFDSLYTSASHEPDDAKNTNTLLTIAQGKNELTVYYKLKEFTATFNGNGGILKAGNEQGATVTTSGTYGQALKLPEVVTAPEGHSFDKWEPAVENETYTSNKTYKALWKAETYNAIFEIYDGEGKLVDTIEVPYAYGKEIEAPAYEVPEGYNFTSWNIPEGTTMGAGDMTFDDAVLTPIDYTLTYTITGAPEGTSVPAAQTGNIGETLTVAKAPEVEGYAFDGWYDEAGNSYKADGKGTITMVKGGLTLEGTYTPVTVNIYYNTGNSVVITPNPATANFGDTVTFPGAEAMNRGDNYKFAGWADAQGNDAGASYTVDSTDDVTFTAKWEYKVKYTVSDAPEGVPEAPAAEFYAEGDDVVIDTTTPETITVDGVTYTFSGWQINGKDAENFTMGTEPVEITGSWTKVEQPKEYTISYAYTGTVPAGADALLPAAHKAVEGTENVQLADALTTITVDEVTYTFSGWYYNANITTKIDKMPAHDVTVTGYWTAQPVEVKEYTLTINPNGGTLNGSTEPFEAKYTEGTVIPPVAEPVREGFNFKGWNPGIPTTMPANDLTVVAQWEAKPEVKTGTLTMDANGGVFASNGTDEATKDYAVGETINVDSLEEPTKSGFTFAGWDGIPEDGKMPEGGVTITAKWEEVPETTHTITYYLAQGEGVAPFDTKSFEEGATIVSPDAPKQEGAEFVGWFDAAGNKLPDVMGSEDIVVYAKYELNTYKATFMVDGEVYKEFELLYGEELKAPAAPTSSDPTKVFSRWNPYVPSTMPAEDMVFTAEWATVTEGKYMATFLVDGESHSTKFYAEGETIEVPEDPEKFGFVFVGWEPEVPDAMPAQDMTFEAQWEIDKDFVTVVVGGTVVAGGVIATIAGINAAITGAAIVGGVITIIGIGGLVKNTHTVTYLVDGEVYKTYKVIEGTKIPVPADPTKEGFNFEGWNPEVPEKMGESDLVFEAEWSEKSDNAEIDVPIPDTGSVAGGLTAFAIISGAAAAAYVITRKKKED